MKIAIIGAGISGLTAANILSEHHDVHVIERASRIGGHTATIDVEYQGEHHAIDTGFIVYNDRTYPNFIALLKRLGVKTKPSVMSFSVSDPHRDFEYAGSGLSSLFAKKSHIFSLSFWVMLKDIVRFNRRAEADLQTGAVDDHTTLNDYLLSEGYSQSFIHDYLIPMGSAIWSASISQILNFPLRFFVQFFSNHGLLTIFDKPTWRVINKGSRNYIPALCEPFKDNIRTNIHVERVVRESNKVTLVMYDGSEEIYDHVVFACHSDQALSLLAEPSKDELAILGTIKYEENLVVLHTDENILPNRKKTWSSWNYLLKAGRTELPILTYNMNILQGIKSRHTFCVTLNANELIDPKKIIARYHYAHPQFSIETKAAQLRKEDICGHNRSSFCGAYWANGFHEDGVTSAIDACSRIQA